jgi:hypothetical protein
MYMSKEKVTLTLDSDQLRQLRSLTGARGLSAAVDDAVSAYLAKWRHLHAVDEWLAEMEREFGAIPEEAQEWAAKEFERWEANRTRPTNRTGVS